MKLYNLGNCSKEYVKKVYYWAKRLEATEVIIHSDKTVTLTCPDGCICNAYKPTPAELKPRAKTLTVLELAAFYGEYGIQ